MNVESRESRVEAPKGRAKLPLRRRRSSAALPVSAFTLIELLVVIAILGIMAGLTVPVLKNFAKSDATLGASRQLLDGAARARQLAISQRTTVYMVFMPTNFWAPTWMDANGQNPTAAWSPGLTLAQRIAVTNLCDKQLTGYTFVSLRSVGDQPGQGRARYLDQWQTLPDGTFVAFQKFYTTNTIVDNTVIPPKQYPISIFNYTTNIPFPTATNAAPSPVSLPFIAFNYLGQLTADGQTVAGADEYIPIAKGSVIYAADAGTKMYQFNSADILETPPGNSTNSSYTIIHIERLTGRAVLEYQKLQ